MTLGGGVRPGAARGAQVVEDGLGAGHVGVDGEGELGDLADAGGHALGRGAADRGEGDGARDGDWRRLGSRVSRR